LYCDFGDFDNQFSSQLFMISNQQLFRQFFENQTINCPSINQTSTFTSSLWFFEDLQQHHRHEVFQDSEQERCTDASRICKGQTLWQRNGYRAVRANVTTINRKQMHS
jgi:hypothetical protein